MHSYLIQFARIEVRKVQHRSRSSRIFTECVKQTGGISSMRLSLTMFRKDELLSTHSITRHKKYIYFFIMKYFVATTQAKGR